MTVAQRLHRLRSSEIGRRLSKGLLWGGLATVIGRGLPQIGMIVTARLLGPAEFGNLTLLFSTALSFEVLVSAGLAVTCTKFMADLKLKDPSRAGRVIDLANIVSIINAVVIGGLVVALAPWLAKDVLATPDLIRELYWSAILVGVIAMSAVQQGTLIGLEAFRATALVEMVGGVAILLFVPLGATWHGVQGALLGMITGYGLRLVALHVAVVKQTTARGIPRRWVLPLDELSVLWRFSLPGMLNSMLWAPAMWCAMAIIAHQPNGQAEVGVFNAANLWFSLLMFLPGVVNQTAFPILTERLNAGATGTAWRLFYGKLLVTVGGVTVAALALAVLSPVIMGFYGAEYSEKWPVLVTIAIAAWLAAPQGPMGNLLMAHAKPWSWFRASLVWAICLLLAVALFRDHGAVALAWGLVAAYAARGLYASLQIYRLRVSYD